MDKEQERGRSVLKQHDRLKAIRDPLDQEYRDCYRFTYPNLGAGFNQENNGDGVSNAGTTRTQQAQLMDSTATDAVRLLSSSVQSSLTPPGSLWFNLEVPNADEDALDQDSKEWLEDSAQRIHTMIHGSNFDCEAPEFMTHSMIAGMAGLYVEMKGGKLYFESWPLHHLYCQETLHLGYIDTVYRSFYWTVQEAVNEFGLDAMPQNMKDAFSSDPHGTKKHRFVVAIRPRMRNGKQSVGKTQKNLPWESIWVAQCGTIVKESGFHEMPVIVPRWMRIPDTDYARGPVFDALPDIKSVNAVKSAMHENMAMHISGMYKVKDDGVVNPATIKIGARRIIPVGDMDNLQILKSGGDIQFAMNEIQGLQASIRRVLLADQLGPTEKAIQTATEVQTRNNQVRQILGPIFARFQAEFLQPFVERCFGMALRAGALPRVPDGLRDRVLTIKYRSPLARSQKMLEVQAIDEFMNRLITTAANTQKPDLLDVFDFEKGMQEVADLLGVDAELMVSPDKLRQMRAARAKAQEAAQQQAQQAEMMQAAMKAGPQTAEPAVA
jgi:hypothetical protein